MTAGISIREGDTGLEVEELQRRLFEMGYYFGEVAGVFGPQTRQALVNFQQSNGLTADGVAGFKTLSLLGLYGGAEYQDELRLLAAAIYSEARGEPYEGQVAVGAVIMNRVNSPLFPNTIGGVIFQAGAFEAVQDGMLPILTNAETLRAAVDAISGVDPTNGALYYWNPVTATSRWIWSIPITSTIGKHVFGTPPAATT